MSESSAVRTHLATTRLTFVLARRMMYVLYGSMALAQHHACSLHTAAQLLLLLAPRRLRMRLRQRVLRGLSACAAPWNALLHVMAAVSAVIGSCLWRTRCCQVSSCPHHSLSREGGCVVVIVVGGGCGGGQYMPPCSQDGTRLALSETDRRALVTGLALHDMGRASMRKGDLQVLHD